MEAGALISELKRRRVIRALVGYGIAGFAVLQIIEPIMHGLHWPDEVLSYVVVALAVGFPIVVALAWIFDVNAGQIERTAPALPATGLRGARLALLLIGIGVLAAAPGMVWYFYLRDRWLSRGGTMTASIAVLPFANISPESANEYFSDGMTEELINALCNVEGLRVASRTSSFALKGKNLDARQIGERLNVKTLLEGSVRREGNVLRVTVQLVNVSDDVHIWSKTYNGELKSVFALEDEIAHSIAQALRHQLAAGESSPLVRRSTASVEAHDLYLQGMYFKEKRNADALRKAASYFQDAVEKDPTYALAWVGLSEATMLQNEYDQVLASSVLPRARKAILRALEIDPGLAEAHATRAWISSAQFDWKSAEGGLRKAIEIKPENPTPHHRYSLLLSYLGRLDEAAEQAKTALRLDPISPIINNLIGVTRLYRRDFDGAIAGFKRTLEMEPSFGVSHALLGNVYAAQGRYAEADAEYSKGMLSYSERFRGMMYINSGRRAEALRLVEEMDERAKRGYVSPAARGLMRVALGEKDRGYALLDRACAENDWRLRDTKVDPLFDRLREEPRFKAVLQCVHLQ